MTLGEFRKKTAHLPDTIDIMVEQTNNEGRYGMSQSVFTTEIEFKADEIPKKDWATEECLIISDDF